jgi:hypothetical protein
LSPSLTSVADYRTQCRNRHFDMEGVWIGGRKCCEHWQLIDPSFVVERNESRKIVETYVIFVAAELGVGLAQQLVVPSQSSE